MKMWSANIPRESSYDSYSVCRYSSTAKIGMLPISNWADGGKRLMFLAGRSFRPDCERVLGLSMPMDFEETRSVRMITVKFVVLNRRPCKNSGKTSEYRKN